MLCTCVVHGVARIQKCADWWHMMLHLLKNVCKGTHLYNYIFVKQWMCCMVVQHTKPALHMCKTKLQNKAS